MQVADIEFRPGGLVLFFDDGTEVTGTFRVRNQILFLDGLDSIQRQALAFFKRNQIDAIARLDPRLATLLPEVVTIPTFEIIKLPDTQFYSSAEDTRFNDQTKWITSNLGGRNIKFVTQVGDIVDAGVDLNQWIFADTAMSTLDGAVPYSVCLGNHDLNPINDRSVGSDANYQTYFGPDRFTTYSWFKGSSPSGRSTYQLFTANGRTYLHMSWELEIDGADATWVTQTLNDNCQYPTIITTHRMIEDDDSVQSTASFGGTSPRAMIDTYVKPNPQIFLVLCGHDITTDGEGFLQESNDDGQLVYFICSNYQNQPNNGNGWLRILEFDEQGSRINVSTFSPTLNDVDPHSGSKFSIELNFVDRLDIDFCPDPTDVTAPDPTDVTDPSVPSAIFGSLWWSGINPSVTGGGVIENGVPGASALTGRKLAFSGVSTIEPWEDVVLDEGRQQIYWTEPGSDCIFKANMDGTGKTVFHIIDNLIPTGLDIDLLNDRLYYSCIAASTGGGALTDGQIRRIRLIDGLNDIPVVTGLASPRGVALDVAGDQLFWCDDKEKTVGQSATIGRSSLDGSNVVTIATPGGGLARFNGLRVYKGLLWWCDSDRGSGGSEDGSLWMSNLNGSSQQVVISHVAFNEFRPHRMTFEESDTPGNYGTVYMTVLRGPTGSARNWQIISIDLDAVFALPTLPGFLEDDADPVVPNWEFDFASYPDGSAATEFASGIVVEQDVTPLAALNEDRLVFTTQYPQALTFGAVIIFRTPGVNIPINPTPLAFTEGVHVDKRPITVGGHQTFLAYYCEGAFATSPPGNEIRRFRTDGSLVETLITSPDSGNGPSDITLDEDGDLIYWVTVGTVDVNDSEIREADVRMTEGHDIQSSIEVIAAEGSDHYNLFACTFSTTNGLVYYTDARIPQAGGQQTKLYSIDPTNANRVLLDTVTSVLPRLESYAGICVDDDNGHIYVVKRIFDVVDTTQVVRFNLDGTGETLIADSDVDNIGAPVHIDWDPIQRALYTSDDTLINGRVKYIKIIDDTPTIQVGNIVFTGDGNTTKGIGFIQTGAPLL